MSDIDELADALQKWSKFENGSLMQHVRPFWRGLAMAALSAGYRRVPADLKWRDFIKAESERLSVEGKTQ